MLPATTRAARSRVGETAQRSDDGPRRRGDDEGFGAEDPSEHGVVGAALNEREAGDVENWVPLRQPRETEEGHAASGQMPISAIGTPREPGGERREPPQADELPARRAQAATGSKAAFGSARTRRRPAGEGGHDDEDVQ